MVKTVTLWLLRFMAHSHTFVYFSHFTPAALPCGFTATLAEGSVTVFLAPRPPYIYPLAVAGQCFVLHTRCTAAKRPCLRGSACR